MQFFYDSLLSIYLSFSKDLIQYPTILLSDTMHIKIEHIESLARGKKSGVGIGSRSVPHRLTQKEWRIFEEAKKDGYLSIPKTRRVNLENIYWQYTQMQGKECLIIEEQDTKTSVVYRE